MKQLKPTPQFSTEAEEVDFWQTHDSSEYLDWSKSERVRLPNLKPTTKSISIRLTLDMIERIKLEANKIDVPYQSLIKVWLEDKLHI